MPFTFSHPAIILPLANASARWFSFTGLIMGSIVPDFEYFIRMRIRSSISHTIPGLFYFDLPLGILLAFGFHLIIRNPLYNNLPEPIAQRLLPSTGFQWNKYFKGHAVIVAISVLLGALTHLLWDGFTHAHGLFAPHIIFLTRSFEFFGNRIAIYQILQHVSTLMGGLCICYFIYKLPSSKNMAPDRSKAYWPILILVTTGIVVVRMLFGITGNAFGQFVGTSISALLIALLITPFIDPKKYHG